MLKNITIFSTKSIPGFCGKYEFDLTSNNLFNQIQMYKDGESYFNFIMFDNPIHLLKNIINFLQSSDTDVCEKAVGSILSIFNLPYKTDEIVKLLVFFEEEDKEGIYSILFDGTGILGEILEVSGKKIISWERGFEVEYCDELSKFKSNANFYFKSYGNTLDSFVPRILWFLKTLKTTYSFNFIDSFFTESNIKYLSYCSNLSISQLETRCFGYNSPLRLNCIEIINRFLESVGEFKDLHINTDFVLLKGNRYTRVEDEGSGFKKLYFMLPEIISGILQNKSIILVQNINQNLHPLLTRHLFNFLKILSEKKHFNGRIIMSNINWDDSMDSLLKDSNIVLEELVVNVGD